MSKKKTSETLLSWDVIKNFFAGQWVELYRVDWRWNRATPARACVRNHADTRRELLALIERSGAASDGVIVRIGRSLPLIEHAAAEIANHAS